MADIWFDVDTALAEVPVNVLPLLDDADAKTIEDAVAYNAAGLALNWHFVTSAGAYTVTAVTPTTAGNYDWADTGTSGVYTIEIPASGGASINNDTEGYGWFTGVATGILPWRSPIYGFRAAAINDSLCDTNTTGLLAPTTAGRTLDVTATGAAGIDWGNVENPTTALNLSGTNIDVDQVVASVSGAVGSVTGAVGSVTGNVDGNVVGSVGSVASGGITAASLAADCITAAKVAADVTTEIQAGLATAAALATVDGIVDDILTDTGTTLPATLASVVGYIDTEVAAILAAVDTEVAAIKAKTDSLTFTVANQVDANAVAISGDATAADNLETAFDDTAGPVPWMGIADQGTAQSATATTVVLRSGATFADDTIIGAIIAVYGSTQGYWQFRQITDYLLSTDTVTVDTWTVTPSGATITYKIFGTAPASASSLPSVNLMQINGQGIGGTKPYNTAT